MVQANDPQPGDKPDEASTDGSNAGGGPSGVEQDAPIESGTPGADTGPAAADEVLSRMAPAEAPKPRASRPPLWLIVLTLAIPVTLGTMWYRGWYGRPLDCSEIAARLNTRDQEQVQDHALYQFRLKAHGWYSKYYEKAGLPAQDPAREAAMIELGICFPAVIEYAKSKPTLPRMQTAVADALGYFQISPTHAAEASRLLHDMALEGTQEGKFQAACSLARMRDKSPVVLQHLRAMLERDEVDVRANAVVALQFVGDSRDAARLRQMAESDPNQDVRALARRAYEELAARPPF